MNNLIEAEKIIKPELDKIDNIVFLNSKKVLDSFQKNSVSEYHFNSTTGYGYNDDNNKVK